MEAAQFSSHTPTSASDTRISAPTKLVFVASNDDFEICRCVPKLLLTAVNAKTTVQYYLGCDMSRTGMDSI